MALRNNVDFVNQIIKPTCLIPLQVAIFTEWAWASLGSTTSPPWRPSPTNAISSSLRAAAADRSPLSGASRTAGPKR